MRLLVKKGKLQRPLFVGKAQQYVDTEDFICAMMQHAKPGGAINNVFIDFENTQILVSNVAEVRVVAQMAAAYYNATLAQNLSCQKDLYGMPYTNTPTDATKSTPVAGAVECANKAVKSVTGPPRTAGRSGRNYHKHAPKQQQKPVQQQEPGWDEEMHGDRLVYDDTYEINEHLVPWLMNPDKWEERYGLY